MDLGVPANDVPIVSIKYCIFLADYMNYLNISYQYNTGKAAGIIK